MSASSNLPIPLKGGTEYDMLSQRARRIHIRRPGDAKAAKNSYQRRARQAAKRELKTPGHDA